MGAINYDFVNNKYFGKVSYGDFRKIDSNDFE